MSKIEVFLAAELLPIAPSLDGPPIRPDLQGTAPGPAEVAVRTWASDRLSETVRRFPAVEKHIYAMWSLPFCFAGFRPAAQAATHAGNLCRAPSPNSHIHTTAWK